MLFKNGTNMSAPVSFARTQILSPFLSVSVCAYRYVRSCTAVPTLVVFNAEFQKTASLIVSIGTML